MKSEEKQREIKDLIIRYYAESLMNHTDKLWDEKGYTQANIERMINSPL